MRRTVDMWRCAECGKWSHAQKDPRHHQRWVKPGDPFYDPEKNENDYGNVADFGDVPDGHYITCGPFEKWVARPGKPTR